MPNKILIARDNPDAMIAAMHTVLENPGLRGQVAPLSVEAYHALGEMGFIEEKSELIHGFILPKMPKTPRHFIVCQRLLEALRAAASRELSIRQEQPITSVDSEPEPDIAEVRGTMENFAHTHPVTAALAIEVSISSLERDLEKAGIYAAAGVEEFWLIRPDENAADVFTIPGPQGYAVMRRIEKDGVLTPSVIPNVRIRMEELLA